MDKLHLDRALLLINLHITKPGGLSGIPSPNKLRSKVSSTSASMTMSGGTEGAWSLLGASALYSRSRRSLSYNLSHWFCASVESSTVILERTYDATAGVVYRLRRVSLPPTDVGTSPPEIVASSLLPFLVRAEFNFPFLSNRNLVRISSYISDAFTSQHLTWSSGDLVPLGTFCKVFNFLWDVTSRDETVSFFLVLCGLKKPKCHPSVT